MNNLLLESALTKTVVRYPHLKVVCDQVRAGSRQALNQLQLNMGMCAMPPDMTVAEIRELLHA